MFYLRESSLLKKFESKVRNDDEVDSKGRCKPVYEDGISFLAILTDATTAEKEQYNRLSHPITHTITHRGGPVVKEEDYLILGDRTFYVQGVEVPGGLNLWTIYNVEERRDFND